MSIKLQTLVYDILLSTTAIFSYIIGSRKLSANEQFFGARCQKAMLGVCVSIRGLVHFLISITAHIMIIIRIMIVLIKRLSLTRVKLIDLGKHLDKNHSRLNRDGALLFYQGWMRLMFTWVLWR